MTPASYPADRDGNGAAEIYRTGYWRRFWSGGEPAEGTFFVVFERGRQRDLVDTTAPDGEDVFLSWLGGGLTVSDCNCPFGETVDYAHGRLALTPNGGKRDRHGEARCMAPVPAGVAMGPGAA